MAALGIHQHAVGQHRVALPFEPRTLRPAAEIGAVATFQHQPFDAVLAHALAQLREVRPVGEADQRREVETLARPGRHPGLQPHASFVEGEGAQVLALQPQHVVKAHVRRMLLQHLGRHGLAVQPLLQIVERRHRLLAPHQQLAVEHAVEIDRLDDVGERTRHVLAGAAVEPLDATRRGNLDADAVPFPFRAEMRGIERIEFGPLDGIGQHRRQEGAAHIALGLGRAGQQPIEQRAIRGAQPMPNLLDFVDRMVADIGGGLLGQTRRHADAERPGQQLQQRPPAGGVERIEPALQDRRGLHLGRPLQGLDDLAQAGRRPGVGIGLPDQRQGLGEVADIVVGEMEQLLADLVLAEAGKIEPAGQRRQGPAAVGIGRLAQVSLDQPKLGIARRLEGERIEQLGEGLH